jgi:16S rRNA (guanine(966)-N(2))-methyltransferase RsmD
MRTQIRIVAGSLRGRKLVCNVEPSLRPTPQRVRESLFSILGDAVPDRAFYDVFAGTGVNGMEAISRGASSAVFLERDAKLIGDMTEHFKRFDIQPKTRIVRTDVYRWIERWTAPPEPICVFLSPPFSDLQRRKSEMLQLITALQEKVAPASVVVLQSERCPLLEMLPDRPAWDERRYGRNHLLFWVKPVAEPLPQPTETPPCPPQ